MDSKIATIESAEQPSEDERLMSLALAQGPEGVDALERLIAMRERAQAVVARQHYDSSMLAVQSVMPQIPKRGKNTQNGARFAKLEDIDKAIRPIYTREGFRLTFTTRPCPIEGWVIHVATVSHPGGHVEEHEAPFPIDTHGPKGQPVKTGLHGAGSSLSYAQRRLTQMAFGLVPTGEQPSDDDGQAAGTRAVEYVTAEQAADLQALASEIGIDEGAFFTSAAGYIGSLIAAWSDVPVDRFAGVVRALESRR